jgi:ABC-type multidrug transport system permease subunit
MLTGSIVVVLLITSLVIGVQYSLTWAFLPIFAGILLTMSGMTFFIASYAPSAEVGNIMSNLLGIFLVFVSPVYFPAEQAPFLLRMAGYVSPFRYAADGLMASLSGSTDVWFELAVVTGFAVVSMSVGLWKQRWREP